jgi:pimeloyl-ACP methyl ester carboxylesterase
MLAYPTEERIRGVLAPVLVVRGAADPVARSDWCRMLANQAKRGRLLEIRGSRHVVQCSAPDRVARAIAAFAGAPLPAAA